MSHLESKHIASELNIASELITIEKNGTSEHGSVLMEVISNRILNSEFCGIPLVIWNLGVDQ